MMSYGFSMVFVLQSVVSQRKVISNDFLKVLFVVGVALVWLWYSFCMVLVRFWSSFGVDLVWTCNGYGMDLQWFW